MHLDGFIKYLNFEKRYSHHTIEAYRSDLFQFSTYLLVLEIPFHPDLTDVSHRQIRSWIMSLMDKGIEPKSVNRKISTLKTYYKYLLKREVITKNPMLKVVPPKTAKPLPVYVDQKSMERIFQSMNVNNEKGIDKQVFIKIRDLLIVDLLYSTGIRRSELLGLNELSLNQAAKTLKVLGKGNKERILPVSNRLMDTFCTYLKIRDVIFGHTESLFLSNTGSPASSSLIYSVVKRVLTGNTSLTRRSPHVLRHSFATHLSNNGAELNAIKDLLGHASLASTQVYTHNSIEKLKQTHKQAHPKA